MPPRPIVRRARVLEELGFFAPPARFQAASWTTLDLQRREKALGDGIVPAIAATAHAADDSVLRQHSLVKSPLAY